MTRLRSEKAYIKSFQRGFISEATGLSFPDGAAKDLDNVDIELNGTARRRLGLDQERGGVLIGSGKLDDETILGTKGGPLSLAAGQAAVEDRVSWTGESLTSDDFSGEDTTSATFAYLDNDVSPNNPAAGDVTAIPNQTVVDFTNAIELYSQDDRNGSLLADLNFNTYDQITFSAEVFIENGSGNFARLGVCLGNDSNGQGLRIDFTDHNWNQPVRARVFDAFDGAANPESYFSSEPTLGLRSGYYTVQITCNKVDTNLYNGGFILIDSETDTVLMSRGIDEFAVFGDFIGFNWFSSNPDPSIFALKDIDITLETLESTGDTGDEVVTAEEVAITVHRWPSPNGEDDVDIVVTQIGNTLYFRDADGTPISATGGDIPVGSESLSFDSANGGFIYNTTAAAASKVRLQSSVGLGRLWFTSKATIPFYAELDRSVPSSPQIVLRANGTGTPFANNAVTGSRIIRDFIGVEDNLDVDENTSTLTEEHAYNLLNQGWGAGDYVDDYLATTSLYPSNAQQWFIGKDANNDFDPGELVKIDTGTTQAPRGRFTMDALVGSRDGKAHTIAGVDNPIDFDEAQDEKSATGWRSVAFFEGRVFYAGEENRKRPNGVYFSRTLRNPRDSGYFMQEADPTSENITDLVATDGGVIYITEADRIRKLVPFLRGLLVMARNGIWYIYGGETNFTATSYAVEKISSTGVLSPETVVNADTSIVFWAENSIHRISPGNGRLPVIEDIAEETILSHYAGINKLARNNAWGVYDSVAKRVTWQYKEDYDGTINPSLFDKALICDMRPKRDPETGTTYLAFTKYSFTVDTGDDFYGVGPAFSLQVDTDSASLEIVTELDGTIVTELDGTTPVLAYEDNEIQGQVANHLRFLLLDGRSNSLGLRIASLLSTAFIDYESLGLSGAYTSYIEAYDETLDDLKRDKQVTYLHSYFRRTESGFDTDLIPTNQSKCTVQARWEWHNTSSGNRWGTAQQAYRYRKPFTPANASDPFDTGESIIHTKLKIRGQGRAVSFYFESEAGKDFQLLGYHVDYTANGER